MRISFNAVVIVEMSDKLNFDPGFKDIRIMLEQKGIVASKPIVPGEPMILEFKMDEVRK